MDIIKFKLIELEQLMDTLNSLKVGSLENYLADLKAQATYEHYFERILEAITKIVFTVVKIKKLRLPDDDKHSFELLAEHKILTNILAKRLIDAKGMRNIIAHEYGKVDHEKVFEAVNNELKDDVNEFINQIKLYL